MILCDELWGSADISESTPNVSTYNKAVFVPNGENYGIYKIDGEAIKDSIDFAGLNRITNRKNFFNADGIKEYNNDEVIFFIGYLNNHYGHFMINTLSRLWVYKSIKNLNAKIVCNGIDIDSMFNISFVKTIFDALGLKRENFLKLEEPVILNNVIVANTSFEEQRKGYSIFRELGLDIRAMIKDVTPSQSGETERTKAIYYSKSKLTSGVGGFSNEKEIEDIMASKGVKIIYPEQLSFQEQISVIENTDVLYGTAGSFLHNVIFCRKIPKIIVLNPSLQINSNFCIFDKLTNANSTYLYDDNTVVLDKSVNKNFLTYRALPNLKENAYEMLEIGNI